MPSHFHLAKELQSTQPTLKSRRETMHAVCYVYATGRSHKTTLVFKDSDSMVMYTVRKYHITQALLFLFPLFCHLHLI